MVTPHYAPHVGGVEQHVHEVSTRIAASGRASVDVITTGAELGLPVDDRDGDVAVTRLRAFPLAATGCWLQASRGGCAPAAGTSSTSRATTHSSPR